MKAKIFITISTILVLAACKQEAPSKTDETTTTTPIVKEAKPESPRKECYRYDANGTTISLEMHQNGSDVNGNLAYRLKEKDSNKGTFIGAFENGIYLLDYTFQSEGTVSTRQVAFKLVNGKLVEGYGDMNEDGTRFKDASQLKFTSTMPLSKIDCAE